MSALNSRRCILVLAWLVVAIGVPTIAGNVRLAAAGWRFWHSFATAIAVAVLVVLNMLRIRRLR